MSTKARIAVLGAGAWGTALSVLLARNGFPVSLWGRNAEHLRAMAQQRVNAKGLPGVPLPATVEIQTDLGAITPHVMQYLIAVPSHAFRAVLESIRSASTRDTTVAWATKGLEQASSRLLSDVARDVLKNTESFAVMSGPTFAGEVARGLPTALTVASTQSEVAERVAGWLRNDRLRVYTGDDIAGVQLGGAIKNVMAIAAGISDGLGFGANARAALITRGLAELTRLGVVLGGKPETFMGLAGAGDLILTCTDNTSRNRRVGLGLGKGRQLKDVLIEIGQEAEGIATAAALHRLAVEHQIDMPITEQVYRVLHENFPPQAAVEALLKRGTRSE